MRTDMHDPLLARLEQLRAAPLTDPNMCDRILARLPTRPEVLPLVPASRTLRTLEFPIVYGTTLAVLALGRFLLDFIPSFGTPLADFLGLTGAAGTITWVYARLVTERRDDILGPPSPRRVNPRMAPASDVPPLGGGTALLHGSETR